mmetsp:Transcript_34480/g.51153  ORF Transcript_34480/g.51153 Transcript_34480/m.51153 type:complete len:238 (-) Transcript_34480:471-1184(-)
MPCDAAIQVAQKEGEKSRHRSKEDSPNFSVNVAVVNKPRSCSVCFGLVLALVREVRCACRITARKSRLKSAGDVESLCSRFFENSMLNHRPNNDGCRHREVKDEVTDRLIEEGRLLHVTEKEDQPRRSKTEDDTKETACPSVVVRIFFCQIFVRRMTWNKVSQDTIVAERITDSVKDEDTHDQQSKNLVSETSGELDITSNVEESSEEGIYEKPNGDPCVESEVWHSDTVRHGKNGS